MSARIVPRFERVMLAGDYSDVWLDARANPPMSVFDEFQSMDRARIRKALVSMVKGSNLEDEDGKPINLATEAGWLVVPVEFLNAAADALAKVIASPKATNPSSAPTSDTGPGGAPPAATPS